MELTEQAVARQYDNQRPTGAFLSGGTDSSTVSGMLGKVSGQPARTFSIGFEAEGFSLHVDSTRLRERDCSKVIEVMGKAALVLGCCFISEGAIPFAAKDPLRVIPASIAGGALTGALSMVTICTSSCTRH